ncbi:MAG: hypothetical protein RLZZ407_487 [Pseudomonadota bacterium]
MPVTQTDNDRPIGNTPITDAAAATAPAGSSGTTASDAAVTATGEDIDNDHADERPVDRSQDSLENYNSEQDDESAQAQTVSDDAIRNNPNGESEHGGTTNPAQIYPDDAQDVVDHMHQMERSGQIDMDAYRGERSDDDEPETLGEAALEPGDVDSHGNRSRNPG